MTERSLTERVVELETKMAKLVELMFIEDEVAENYFGLVPRCSRALNRADEALNILGTNGIKMK